MAPTVEPTFARAAISKILPLVSYHATGDWVVPSSQDAIAAVAASVTGVDMTAGPHNAYAYDAANSSGLTVRIDTGEAFVGGRWLASDDVTAVRTAIDGATVPVHDVTLPASATTTVYVGPDDRSNQTATDQLIIGPAGEFPSANTPKIPLYDFTTDASTVTGVTDRRVLEQTLAEIPGSDYARTDVDETFEGSVRAALLDDTTVRHGRNPAETITETTSPTSFTFTAGGDRDISERADVTLSNGTTASVTEDVTVSLYDGVDTTGTLVASQTQSVTVAATSTSVVTFLATRQALDAGDYHVAISTSGTTLAVDQTALVTTGGEWTVDETDTGDRVLTDHDGVERGRWDAIGGGYSVPSVSTEQLSNTVFIQGTSDIATVNSRLQNTPSGAVAHLIGTFTVGTTPVEIPSDTTVVNWGTLRQADATSGTTTTVVENANASRSGTDNHITFINHGIIDGNAGNQTAQNADRHAVVFRGVDHLSFYGVRVVDPLDFAMRVEACNDVRFRNFSCEINFVEDHQDGLHFVDSNQVVGQGVSGVAEDDLLAITVDQDASISDYAIHGVEGTSLDADIVRINRSVASLNDTTSKSLENISVTGIVGYDPAFDGVVLRDADANTTYRNVHVGAVIDNPGNSGVLAGQNAYYEDCSIDLTVRSPGAQGCLMNGVSQWKNGTIRVICRNEVGGAPSLVAANIDSSTIELASEIGGTTPHLHLQSGSEVTINAAMNGSSRGVQLGTGSPTAVTNSVVQGTAVNIGQQDVIEISGSGSNNNHIQMHGSGINVVLDGATSIVNGTGTEDLGLAPTSAPTGAFPAGTVIRNSNADNNETWQLISGTWVQLA